MTVKKFANHKYAQLKIHEYENGARKLISYTTVVCDLDKEGWLKINGLYSRTTIKHIGWFMNDLGFTYQLAKTLYLHNQKFNIYTGEIIDCIDS